MVTSLDATIQQGIDLELAQEQVRQIVAGQGDPDAAAVRAQLNRITGGESSPVAATNGADTWITIYHRYDGREHRMPSYQVAKTLVARIPNDHEAFPPGAVGQIAWSTDPAQAGVLKREYGPISFDLGLPCYFSSAQDDPLIVADVKGAGIPFFCRKGKHLKDGTVVPVRFSDAMALESHLKKHVRAMPAFDRHRETRRNKERDDSTNATNQAILELATRLAAGQPVVAQTAPEPGEWQLGSVTAETFACDVCGKPNKTAAGRAAHMRSHATID